MEYKLVVGTDILQIFILIFAVTVSILRLKKYRNSVLLVFFIYGLVCWLLSDIYWLALDIMLPNKIISFGVNEIAEGGLFLLFASITRMTSKMIIKKRAPVYTLFGVCYILLNVALWIIWNGDILKDLLCGFALGIFICFALNLLYLTDALKKSQLIFLFAGSFGAVFLQYLMLVIPKEYAKILDLISIIFMFANFFLIGVLGLRAALTAKRERTKSESLKTFSLSFSLHVIVSCNLYMTAGVAYFMNFVLTTLIIPLLLSSVILLSSFEKDTIPAKNTVKEGAI